jgi:hypothetical protein
LRYYDEKLIGSASFTICNTIETIHYFLLEIWGLSNSNKFHNVPLHMTKPKIKIMISLARVWIELCNLEKDLQKICKNNIKAPIYLLSRFSNY